MKKLMSFALMAIITIGSVEAQNKADQKKEPAKKKQKEEQVIFIPKVEGPAIEFEKEVHDYGQIAQGDNGDCEFVFTNVGSEPLILQNVTSSCGCTVPSWPREPIAPGAKSAIKVHYDSNRIGGINKSITVTTNGKPERVSLRITGNISPKQ